MLIICSGSLAPELVEAVQRFRGAIYLADEAIPGLTDGRHIEAADARSFHIALLQDGAIRACIRYQQIGKGRARIGGWAVDRDARYSRAGIRVVLETVKLAEKLGDHYGTATATIRHNSAGILQRMGGKSLMRYFDPAYRCEIELIEFRLDAMRRASGRTSMPLPIAA